MKVISNGSENKVIVQIEMDVCREMIYSVQQILSTYNLSVEDVVEYLFMQTVDLGTVPFSDLCPQKEDEDDEIDF